MIYGRPYIAARTISSLLSGTLSSRHFACRSNTPSEDDSPVDYTVHNNASAILGEGRDLWNLRALDFTSLELIMGNIMCKWAVCPSFRLNICRLYSMAEPKINYLPR